MVSHERLLCDPFTQEVIVGTACDVNLLLVDCPGWPRIQENGEQAEGE